MVQKSKCFSNSCALESRWSCYIPAMHFFAREEA